jgi:DnaJ like chaperone protein
MKFAKWIGGGLGWALGGPIGAIIGFAIGAVVDGMTIRTASGPATLPGDFMASLMVLTAAVMKADGKIVKAELDYVKRFLSSQFQQQQTQQYLLLLRDILKQDIPLTDVASQIRQYMDYPARLQLLHYLFGISMADGHLHNNEIAVIEHIATHMGISPADLQSIRAMFVKDINSAYSILEISPSASDEEVKKAYRRMAVKYHPDKVGHLGADMQKAANEKFQQLNTAYEEIKKNRGFN